MSAEHTTAIVQQYLNELAGETDAEPIVRALLAQAVGRLRLLCANLLYRSYPRLPQPLLNLEPDEMLSAVVERLLKALRAVRPQTVRQFFALANQHMRWELNDLARRLDEQPAAVELHGQNLPAPASSGSGLTPDGRRMLEAIDNLPEAGSFQPGAHSGNDPEPGRRRSWRLRQDGPAPPGHPLAGRARWCCLPGNWMICARPRGMVCLP